MDELILHRDFACFVDKFYVESTSVWYQGIRGFEVVQVLAARVA